MRRRSLHSDCSCKSLENQKGQGTYESTRTIRFIDHDSKMVHILVEMQQSIFAVSDSHLQGATSDADLMLGFFVEPQGSSPSITNLEKRRLAGWFRTMGSAVCLVHHINV